MLCPEHAPKLTWPGLFEMRQGTAIERTNQACHANLRERPFEGEVQFGTESCGMSSATFTPQTLT